MSELIVLRENSVDGDLVDADIVGDTIWTSEEYSNDEGVSSNIWQDIRIAFQWKSLISTPANGIEFNGVLEGKDKAGVFSPVGYTFNSFLSTENDREDTIVCDQQLNWSDGGVPNGFFIGGKTIAQVSYNPITLPETWRVRIAVLKQSGTTFTSICADVYAELYNPRA